MPQQNQIAICTPPYSSASDNKTWLTSTVAGGFTMNLHNDFFMVVADNSFAYLFMDNHVHKLDGTTLTGGAGAQGGSSANNGSAGSTGATGKIWLYQVV